MKKIIICILVVALSCVILTSCLEKFQNKEEKEDVNEKTEENIENEEKKEEQEEISVHVHDFSLKNVDDKYLKSQASCTEGGQYYYSCSCGEKGVEAFSIGNAFGHKFGEWKVHKEATYTEEGTKRKTCSVCGAYEDTKIDKLVKPKEETPSKPVVKEEPKEVIPSLPKKERFIDATTARYSADEENGYSIWYSSLGGSYTYKCVDHEGYVTFVLDDKEREDSNVYNSAVITTYNNGKRLRSAVDGKILYTTENKPNVSIIMPKYNKEEFFKDGYIFVCEKNEAFDGVTYKIGYMNPKGEWIIPLSENHPILETIKDKASFSFFENSLQYCGEGIVSFEYYDTYYLYNIKTNTIKPIVSSSITGWDVDSIMSGDISFVNGICTDGYGYGGGYFKLSVDGILEKIPLNFNEDLHEREGVRYYDVANNRVIAIGITYYTEGFSIFDSTGAIIKKIDNVTLKAVNGFNNKGQAQILISNKEGSIYYTVIDINGNFLFDPVKVNTVSVCNTDGEVISKDIELHDDYTVINNEGEVLLETESTESFGVKYGIVKYEKYTTSSNKSSAVYIDLKNKTKI